MKQGLENLIAEGNTQKVIATVQSLTPLNTELKNELALLSNRFQQNEKQHRLNIIDIQDYRTETNRINYALLSVIERLLEDVKIVKKRPASVSETKTVIQNADKIYNIQHIDNANFS